MKIWVTKYALSSGITEHEVPEPEAGEKQIYPGPPYAAFVGFKLGRDAHVSRAAAIAAAEAMRTKKLASLKQQIKDLEGMRF